MAHTKQDIETMIQRMEEFTEWAQLKFNTAKCASLSAINNQSRKYVEFFVDFLGPGSVRGRSTQVVLCFGQDKDVDGFNFLPVSKQALGN